MLQEVLLCLAGYSSPLLRQSQEVETSAKPDQHFPVSPPERALLSKVAHLSDLHIKIRRDAASVSASHRSTICKAVASSIIHNHLRTFLKKIVGVERSILLKDAGYVGGYGIVPLSAVVGEFAPWTRRLEWLWEIVCFMRRPSETGIQPPSDHCTGPSLMDFLRRESNTGYTELEEMVLQLVKTAEMAWLRQLSTWVLYGRLPSSSTQDFFIKPQPVNQTATGLILPDFLVHADLVPKFVQPETAGSILFIGRALNQVRAREEIFSVRKPSLYPALKLLPAHLEYLKMIEIPISPSSFANIIASIRLSTSQHALSQLLPLPQVLDVLRVLKEFLLLGRGEFAISLISNADKIVYNRHHVKDAMLPVRKAGRLDDMTIREYDVATALSETWSELGALWIEGSVTDDTLETGRDLLRMVCKRPEMITEGDATDFSALIFPSPTSLTLSLPPTSPLALFLAQDDISSYSEMNSYLLGIRRAEIHLASLWRHASLRRCHPCPKRSSNIGSKAVEVRLARRKQRENERHQKMRRYWAIASKSQFVISELGGYFQGEIVDGHWRHFVAWLNRIRRDEEVCSPEASRPSTSTLAAERSGTAGGASSQERNSNLQSAACSSSRRLIQSQEPTQSDPATLAKAHQRYLSALRASLLMEATRFTKVLLDVLRLVDHFVALFGRLQTVQQNLDLEMDDGVVDALANHRSDEQEILQELERSRNRLEEQLDDLVVELRDSVDRSNGEGARVGVPQNHDGSDMEASVYIPWTPHNIHGLLMKLEFIGTKTSNQTMEDDSENEVYYSG